MFCSRTQHLVLVCIEPATSGLSLSGLIQQTTNSVFFISQKTRFDISCNKKQDWTFYAMETTCMKCQVLFSWKNEKNISKYRLLKILPRVLSVKVCTNNSRMSLSVHDKTYN